MLIKFVGDVMLGELLENYKRGVHTVIQRGVDPFEFCKDDLKNSDLCIANLECIITDLSNKGNFIRDIHRAPKSSVKILKESGINIVNIANNHMLDHGQKALSDTINNLDSNGIYTFGYSDMQRFQEAPLIIERQGLKVGLLGYNLANYNRHDFSHAIERIYTAVRTAKRKVDFLVLSLHWGQEYADVIGPSLCNVTKRLIFCGCDLIHGHHSHRLQGIVSHNGKLAAPSLGNFIFDDRRPENRLTGVLSVEIDKRGIKHHGFHPYYINKLFQPVPNKDLTNRINALNDKLGRFFLIDDDFNQTKAEYYVTRMARRGHFKNRVRMRVLMLLYLYNYRGNFANVLRCRKRDGREQSNFINDEH